MAKKKRALGLPGLAALRRKAGLSQSDLAKKLNRDETAISHWENGRGGPPSGDLPVLASILTCSIDELFGEAS